jgi:hypothetical protein
LRLNIEKYGLCTSYAPISYIVSMHEIACHFPKERLVPVQRAKRAKRAKNFTFNRTISAADFRQPKRHQRLTPCLHTLEETLDTAISTIKRSKWLEAGYEDACRHVDQKAARRRQAQAFATTRPAAFNNLEHRSHIMLHVVRPTACSWHQGVLLASMIKAEVWRHTITGDAMYSGTTALLFWIEMCSPKQPQFDPTADPRHATSN